MADTIRKQILDALVTHLKGEPWVVSGGIGINPGKTNYKKKELPGISVYAGEEIGSKETFGMQDATVAVEFKYVALLVDSLDSAFDISEDIRGKIINSAVNCPAGLHDRIDYTGGSIDYPATDDEAIQISIMININYETLFLNPYSQEEEEE